MKRKMLCGSCLESTRHHGKRLIIGMSREVKSRKERLVGFILQAFCSNYSNALNQKLLFSILEENTLGEIVIWQVIYVR